VLVGFERLCIDNIGQVIRFGKASSGKAGEPESALDQSTLFSQCSPRYRQCNRIALPGGHIVGMTPVQPGRTQFNPGIEDRARLESLAGLV
jgi:hypothetical protein